MFTYWSNQWSSWLFRQQETHLILIAQAQLINLKQNNIYIPGRNQGQSMQVVNHREISWANAKRTPVQPLHRKIFITINSTFLSEAKTLKSISIQLTQPLPQKIHPFIYSNTVSQTQVIQPPHSCCRAKPLRAIPWESPFYQDDQIDLSPLHHQCNPFKKENMHKKKALLPVLFF